MDGAKLVITTLIFWTILGGLFQLFDMDNYQTGGITEFDGDDESSGLFSKLLSLYTFDLNGIPSSISTILTTIFSFFIGLGIYKLLPFTGD